MAPQEETANRRQPGNDGDGGILVLAYLRAGSVRAKRGTSNEAVNNPKAAARGRFQTI